MVAPRKRLSAVWSFVLIAVVPLAQALADEAEQSPSSFLPGTLKDWFGIGGSVVTAVIAVWGVYSGLRAARNSIKQRESDHRQRQLAASHDMINEVFSDPLARAAMRMMDWSDRTFTYEGVSHIVGWNELRPALVVHKKGHAFGPKAAFIRDAFEAFFDHMLVLNHFINREYLNVEDVAVPLRYYAQAVIRYPDTYDAFLEQYGYSEVKVLLEQLARL